MGGRPTFWPHNLLLTPAAAYYTSFASVGIVIYVLRVKKGYRSLPEAINARYGPLASVAFGEWSVLLSASSACIFDRVCTAGNGFTPPLHAMQLCTGQSRSHSSCTAPLMPNVRLLATCITTACFNMFYV